MDLVLELCDTYALDRVYATLLPAKPSEVAAASINATIPYLITESAFKGAWANLVSFLPHSSAPEIIASPIAKNVTANSSPLSSWPRDYIPRQIISLFVITIIGIHILYYLFAGFSYYFVFNHEMMRHPRFLKNQVRKEIIQSESSFPGMILLTLPWFFGEVRGWSKVYGGLGEVGEYGWGYLVFSAFWFLFVTDFGVYCIHRGLHHPAIYKYIHKPHHKWLIPTPFASHAFHPMDGYAQSLPYHIYVYVFPIHRILFLALFVFVNCWSILIHDSDMITGHPLEKIINGPAHHTLHHLYFTVNYGQYFTWADRAGGSYRQPDPKLDPMHEVTKQDEKEVPVEGAAAEGKTKTD